jgi:hypothetical protein
VIPTSGGYSAYLYAPLMDQFGNYANVSLGGTNTVRATFAKSFGTNFPAEFGLNINFYMMVAARTDRPRIDTVFPNKLTPLQATNTLSFVASSPSYGIATTNIHVTLNGVDVSSGLVFSGSPTSWNVSYPGLQPGTAYTAIISITDANGQAMSTTVTFSTAFPAGYVWEAEDFDFDPIMSFVPNDNNLRYIDNPVPTSTPAANSYFNQSGDLGIDEASLFGNTHPGTYVYRQYDYVATEVTTDQIRQKYLDAQQQSMDPTITDYDVFDWATNGWINYTHTYPAGNYFLYARMSAATAFNLQCALVTNGWGTMSQQTQYLGLFRGTNTSFANWQWVPMVNTNTGSPVIVSIGGTNTLQMTGDYKENVNFFQLVSAVPSSVHLAGTFDSVNGNIVLSYQTQSGFSYTVYYKNHLTDPTWTPLAAAVPGDGTVQHQSDPAINASRFYILSAQ